ncbi:putative oxidoreductase [Sphingomonas changbaiensis NBRC 104936]|uniref:Putative oxidoreductase n=2 Tax=Sphingomonas changbaiensis TaxID=529705 RepID=A0A0E9MPD7_9SPHN|nr:putative oxidoreductase [Sphingomonas changbaiensis NBRC 104936]
MVSPIAWGMWRFAGDDVNAARRKVEAAVDAGVTLFDTADIYGPDNGERFGAAESLLGRVFAESPGLRARMVLATKGGIVIGTPYDSGAAYLEQAIDASLKRLGVEHVDLWQIHRPDILAHPQEVARALEKAQAAGKISAVGVSNFTTWQTAALQQFLTIPIASTQPEFSALALDPIRSGLLDQAMTMDLAVLAWSPLARGTLMEPRDARSLEVAALFDRKAAEFGVDRSAAALSWIMAHPARPIPIVGTQRPDRIALIPQALEPRWTRAEWYAVLQASMGEKLP